jgi:hypothetical protein
LLVVSRENVFKPKSSNIGYWHRLKRLLIRGAPLRKLLALQFQWNEDLLNANMLFSSPWADVVENNWGPVDLPQEIAGVDLIHPGCAATWERSRRNCRLD